ncbi:MAG TPA: sigma 54-interacting transcriptional regulator [Bryobacteraceae bacterium]|jgi:transcriptional regulator with AAA-type ATPase domain|nr:sigma 54-interacting transcriptional regulator [Bryobacteraceae bacterium]
MNIAIQFVYMLFLNPSERAFLKAVADFAHCNPFLPEHTELERQALGPDFLPGEPVWSQQVNDPEKPRENVWRIFKKLEPLAHELRRRLIEGASPRREDLLLYEEAILHLLYQRFYSKFYAAGLAGKRNATHWAFFHDYQREWNIYLKINGIEFPSGHDPVLMFAFFRQIQQAFEQIFHDIIGASLPAARLRGAIWQSIFTHDMRRYRRVLYQRMGEFATLITGPSGTGKELVAKAIAQSRWLPFREKDLTFEQSEVFFPINISALSQSLVESELFGHRRGSFTGAVGDRKGWLETCPQGGSVFLDELGELDQSIQVKLLRVIETRTFHPVGDTASLPFRGKLIAATNRDLQTSGFRSDLYYRLCSDQIVTPSLAEQLADSPQILSDLILYMARRVAGPEAEDLAADVTKWINENLGDHYAWPGNYRELDQCVKNVLIRRDYRPSRAPVASPMEKIRQDFEAGRMTADELISRYAAVVYRQTGSYEETARRLGIDRRTVKAKLQHY